MLSAAIAALANALASPLLVHLAVRGTPVRTRRRAGRLAVGALAAALGATLALLLGALDVPASLAATLATLVGLLAQHRGLRHLRAAADLHRLGAALRQGSPAAREASVQALLTRLRRALRTERDAGPMPHLNVRLRLHASAALLEAGCFEDARALLGELREDDLRGDYDRTSWLAQSTIAALYLDGDEALPRARALFERLPRGGDPQLEERLISLDALLHALEGEHALALDLVGPSLATADAPLARTRLVVRAHALAGLGREDEATRVLHALRDDHGPHALARVVQLRGPASPLAARLAPAGPYR